MKRASGTQGGPVGRRRSSVTREQSGATLIELMLVVAVLGVIMVPLGLVFTTMMRSSSAADDRFDRSGEAQRIGEAWTRDVQSVEPGGVNAQPDRDPLGPQEHCGTTDQSPSYSDTDELRRVTFNWDFVAQADGESTVSRTATWVIKGTGDTRSLIRRYCEDLIPVQERVLAKNLDASSMPQEMLVRGPGSPTQDFCPADGDGVRRKCTIKVGGGYDYELTVTRRVPDYTTAVITQFAPGAPTGLSHDARYQYVNVYWTPPALGVGQTAVTMYRLAVRDGSATGTVIQTIDTPANGTGQQIKRVDGLTLGVQYFVSIRAMNTQGWGDESYPAYGPMIPVPTVPEPPTITSVSAGTNNSVTVNWTNNANDGGSPRTSWSVWAFKEGDDPNVPSNLIGPARPIPDGPGTSGTVVSGLANFTRYRFIVADHNSAGEGFRSASSAAVMAYGNAVFVKNSSGSDSGSCGPIASPCKTVDHAQTRTGSMVSPTIALAGGETYSRFNLASQMVVQGGFSSDFSSAVGPGVSTINDGTGSGSGASGRSAISVYNLAGAATVKNVTISRSNAGAGTTTSGVDVLSSPGLTLDGVTITGGNGADPTGIRIRGSNPVTIVNSSIASGSPVGAGMSAYGIRALSGSTANVTNSTFNASPGNTGSAASGQATSGTAGANGGGGGGVWDGSCNGGGGGSAATNGSWGRAGGNGGSGECGNRRGNDGASGTGAGNGNGGGGGGNGSGNIVCSNADGGGSGGGATNNSGNASSGGAAGGITLPNGDVFGPVGAGSGNAGADGHGGGGAGAGGGHASGSWTSCNDSDRGGGGGAGGQGGQGGLGGAAGSGGGGSFAIYALGSTVNVTGSGSVITASVGGVGGLGQRGGNGGDGGNGGNGGTRQNNSDAGEGGRGGGGSGGGAGSGGGGGAAGPSISVYGRSSTINVTGGAALNRSASGASGGSGGVAGSPGSGGSGGNNGATAGGPAASGAPGASGLVCRVHNGSSCVQS